ncbi:MAG TPA: iron chelate uptake ABC transporter family permease subunit [Gemmatales bacterium]|nr:iron chelate uptake ABC transporter family permease subunit [Gemmatales bacterium]
MSDIFTYNTMLVLLGTSLLGAASGLIGSLAVLRRQSLAGDAFSHAALPGLCLAFMVVGERNLAALLLGAFISGILGLVVVSLLRRYTRIKQDAALGIVLSTFFGMGVVLSRIIQNQTIKGSKAGLDSYILGKTAGIIASDVYLIGSAALLCLIVIVFLFKELELLTFDADFARSQGWPVARLDLILIILLGLVVVIGLPAVGVVMMAALLILPGVTARFWTDRLAAMLPVSVGFGVITGAVGTWLSAEYANLPAGPIIVLIGAGLFLFSSVFAPRRGLIARWRRANIIDTSLLDLDTPVFEA